MNTAKLEKCIAEIKRGNANAFDYVYEHTYKLVFFTAFKILNDKNIAEDVVQDTYLTAFNKIALYKEGSNFCGWLTVIAKRLSINEYNRRKGREFSVDFQQNNAQLGFSSIDDNDHTALDIAKKILNDDEYEIVTMCLFAGYKRREVAEILNMPIGTVTWKYKEALKKIEIVYKEEV